MITELIIDTTNRCPMHCVYCGTDSNTTGHDLPLRTIRTLIEDASVHDLAAVYLGGGCFFSHPHWQEILALNREVQARLVIDVPPVEWVLGRVALMPPSQYAYAVSLSLWGVGKCHNLLSKSDSFRNVSSFLDLSQRDTGSAHVSMVLTRELLQQSDAVIDFLCTETRVTHVYFHRLMPVGRAKRAILPDRVELERFVAKMSLVGGRDRGLAVRFHHTLVGEGCRAGRSRLFVDCQGDVYRCGWVGPTSLPAAVASEERDLIEDVNCRKLHVRHKCPLHCG